MRFTARVLWVSVVLAVSAFPALPCPLFGPASTWAVGHHPDGLAAGDVNGDGFPDLVIANWDADNVSVLLGDGHGSFTAGPQTPVGNGPDFLVAADFNGDSRLDLALVATFDAECRIFLGNGDGTFTLRQSLAGASIQGLATGDFDNDGRPDLAILDLNFAPPEPPTGAFVNLYLGNGDGSVRLRGRSTTLDISNAICAKDVNGDGYADLAVGSILSAGVSVLLGTGDGSFGTQTTYATGAASGVAAGDVDGDGRIDLVTANHASDDVSVLLGDGSGAFGPETRHGSGDGPWAIAAVDLFGRGRADVVTADLDGDTVSLLASGGDGSLGPPVEFVAGDQPNDVAVADFDRDGRLDVAVVNYSSDSVSVLLGKNADRPWIVFTAPDTISWLPVAGALEYNVYRGDLADLVDANEDGLPDAGYGVCRTDQDPDPSDTSFVAPEQPSTGEGFFYLVSVLASSGDEGLGVTSACLPREPTPVCP